MHIHSFENTPAIREPPFCIVLAGRGTTTHGLPNIPMDITLAMIPGRTIIVECECRGRGLTPDFGTMIDDNDCYEVRGSAQGRDFVCNQLLCTDCTYAWEQGEEAQWGAVLQPSAPIRFDYPHTAAGTLAKSITCALMTYDGPAFSCEIGGLVFTTCVSKYARDYRRQALTWNAPVETATLTIIPTDPLPLDRLTEIADDFLLLLSFAHGEQISYFRHEFAFPDDRLSEIWNIKRVWDPIHLRRPISVPLGPFLATAYSNYASWPFGKRQLLKLSVYYHLDAKHASTLETITMSEAIMWEMMIREIERVRPVIGEVRDLKERIEQMYSEWHESYPDVENASTLRDHLLQSLRWMPLREGIRQLVTTLNLRELRTDPVMLKEFRDSIAHSGRLPDACTPESVSDALRELVSLGDQILLDLLCPRSDTTGSS